MQASLTVLSSLALKPQCSQIPSKSITAIEDDLDVSAVVGTNKAIMHQHGIRVVLAMLLGTNPCNQNAS